MINNNEELVDKDKKLAVLQAEFNEYIASSQDFEVQSESEIVNLRK